MQLDAMFLQLGIAGAMLLVMYRIAMRWMANERERHATAARADAERESERTKAIQDGFRADIEAHQAITTTMQRMANQFSRMEGKLDTILDLTPVREIYPFNAVVEPRASRASSEPKVIVEDEAFAERPTPTPRQVPTRQTPSRGTPTVGGEYSHTSKPKQR